MTTPIRPYVVTSRLTGAQRLVRATNQSQAIRYAVRSDYACTPASADDVIALMGRGIKPEDATDSAAPQADGQAANGTHTEPTGE